jgi:hypothetical protein
LSYLLNSQVTSASGAPLPYFPVPANPIDFALASNYFLTLSGTQVIGDSVFPYAYNNASGQLTVSQNSSQPLNISQGTAIVSAGGEIYVLDDGPNNNQPPTNGQIFAFKPGTNGSLQAEADGYTPDNPTYSYPNYVLAANGKSFVYILNQGDNASTTNAQSGIASFKLLNPFQLQQISGATGSTGGTGAGPQCIVEDPSNQFIYTANFFGSTITGLSINQNAGDLTPLSQATKAKDSYLLPGPATWCVVTGRTS